MPTLSCAYSIVFSGEVCIVSSIASRRIALLIFVCVFVPFFPSLTTQQVTRTSTVTGSWRDMIHSFVKAM